MGLRVLTLADKFLTAVEQGGVPVGVNDYQQAPKEMPIYEADDNRECIIGYVDMGQNHAVFKYDTKHAGCVARTVTSLSAEYVRSVTFSLPQGYREKHKAWFNYMESRLESRGIRSQYQVQSSVQLFNSASMQASVGRSVVQFKRTA